MAEMRIKIPYIYVLNGDNKSIYDHGVKPTAGCFDLGEAKFQSEKAES